MFQLYQCKYTIKKQLLFDIKSFSCAEVFNSLSRSYVFLLKHTSPFRSFIFSCCNLIWLLSDIAFQKDYLGTVPDTFPLLEPACFCPLWLYWGLWFIYCCNFWKLFSFFIFFFLKLKQKFHQFFPETDYLSCNSGSTSPFSVP